MDEEQVKVFCKFCGALVATFDDIVAYREYGLLFFKKVCNMKVIGPSEFLLFRTLMGSLYCKCEFSRGLGPLGFSGDGANDNSEEENEFFALMLNQIVMMRGDQQVEGRSSEATVLIEEGCKRNELAAKEKGKSPVADDELGACRKINEHYARVVTRLIKIIRIRRIVGKGEGNEAVAELGARFDQQVPHIQSKLTDIDKEIEEVQCRAAIGTELRSNSQEIIGSIEQIERRITIISSVVASFEKELAVIVRKKVSEATEKAPKVSRTGTETTKCKTAMGEEGSGSNAIAEQAAAQIGHRLQLQHIGSETENLDTRQTSDDKVEKEAGESGAATECKAATEEEGTGFDPIAEQAPAQLGHRLLLQHIGSETENLDTRQTSDDKVEKEAGESGAATECKAAKGDEGTGTDPLAEQAAAQIGNRLLLQYIGSEIENLDTRQTSDDEVEKEAGESGAASECKAATGEEGTGTDTIAEQAAEQKMDEEQVKVFCKFCGAHVATFDDIVAYREYGLRFFKKVDQVVMMRGDQQVEGRSSEATALIEKGCKRNELAAAKEKEKSSVAGDVLGAFRKIHEQYTGVVTRLVKIVRIRAIVRKGEGYEAMAELGARFDQQVSHIHSKLTDIDKEIEEARCRAAIGTELGSNSQEIIGSIEGIERKITIISSVVANFEKELAVIVRRKVSQATEKAPKVSRTGPRTGTTKCKTAMGEEGSGSDAIAEQAFVLIGQVRVPLIRRGQDSNLQFSGQGSYIQGSLHQTTIHSTHIGSETENLDTRQTGDYEVEKEAGESGAATEVKTSSSEAASQK